MYPFHLPRLERRNILSASLVALVALAIVSACEDGTEPTTAASRPDLTTTATGSGEVVDRLTAAGVTAQGVIGLPINQSIATNPPNPAFGVTQTGPGPNGIFNITRAGNTQIALLGQTSGSGIAVRGITTSTGGRAGSFQISNAGNGQSALLGETNGTGRGVHGRATGSGIAGLFQVDNTSNSSPAVLASSTGSGVGVIGLNTGRGRAGVFQISNTGNSAVALDVATNGTGRAGVFLINKASSGATALHAETNGGGRAGTFVSSNPASTANALHVQSNSNGGDAVRAIHTGATGNAGSFEVTNPNSTYSSLYAENKGGNGWALGVVGRSIFQGDVYVIGNLSKPAGSFRIDHPLDPEHKYLSHSFVESPDMLNVYDGTATLDGRGEAVVMLPIYFEALNRDFRYQLTAIGAPGPNLHISQEILNNRFLVAGGVPGTKVSWQVTGVRQDAYAEAHRIQVETDKPSAQRGVALTH